MSQKKDITVVHLVFPFFMLVAVLYVFDGIIKIRMEFVTLTVIVGAAVILCVRLYRFIKRRKADREDRREDWESRR